MRRLYLNVLLVACIAGGALPQHSANAQGQIYFGNFDQSGFVDAPILDGNQQLLNGSRYVAQLWIGDTPNRNEFNPTGIPRPFTVSGYISAASLSFFQYAPGTTLYGEVRARDTQAGATYDEAKIQGLAGATSSSLTIMNVSAVNEGVYNVRATTCKGGSEATTTVVVLQPPTLTSPGGPSQKKLNLGANHLLEPSKSARGQLGTFPKQTMSICLTKQVASAVAALSSGCRDFGVYSRSKTQSKQT